jgi:hypothetical protein
VKQPLDHGDIDTVKDLVLVGTPVIEEIIDDPRTEFEGGEVECRRNAVDHIAIGEGDRTNTGERGC